MADENIMTVDEEATDGGSTSSLNGLALKSRDGYTCKLFLPSTADIATLNTAKTAVNSIDPTARFITSLASEAEPDTADDGKILLLVDCPPYIDSPVTMGVDLITGNPDFPEYYTADITPCIKSTKEPVNFSVSFDMELTLTIPKANVGAYKYGFADSLDLFTIIVGGTSDIANSFYTFGGFGGSTPYAEGVVWSDSYVTIDHTIEEYQISSVCSIPSNTYYYGFDTTKPVALKGTTQVYNFIFVLTYKPRDTSLCVPCGGVDIIPYFYFKQAIGSYMPSHEIKMNAYAGPYSDTVANIFDADAIAKFTSTPVIEYVI